MHALIVDDSPTARTLARIALDEAATAAGVDFDVDEADGGIEALRVLASSDVDLLIVDLHMPGIHGLEVLARLPAAAPRYREDPAALFAAERGIDV